MNEWQPIARGAPQIVGLDEGGRDRDDTARVEVTLSAVPPFEWVEYFRAPNGVTPPSDIRAVLAREQLSFSLPAPRLEEYMGVVDQLIGQANDRYATNVVPRLAKQAADARDRANRELDGITGNEDKLTALRRRAEGL
jgi:hypothetical protein